MFNKEWKGWKVAAIVWLFFISTLFFLPGDDLPKANWLDSISFDKWVHVAFFGCLAFLWSFYFPDSKAFNYWLFGALVMYGFAVEVIQYFWVVNRSFDLIDLASDTLGAALGLLFWSKRYIKK